MGGYIRIIDPATGEVMFDSDEVTPEMMDPERDHMAARENWSISTREQMNRQIDATRPSRFDCDTCESKGVIYSLNEWIICPTCHGVVRGDS